MQCEAIAQVIVPRTVDLGDGFAVRRALPSARTRMVGPFIFFDHFGPAEFRAGNGLDVRPHPHIGLATVTYLFDGEIMHRDSLGTAAAIKPGEVNWMTAGRGIVHSERTGAEKRAAGGPIHGLQMWVALPAAKEEMEAGFAHHDTAEFPVVAENGKTVRVVVGSLYGATSPVPMVHETIFADVHLTGRLERCRSMPITRSARSMSSTARSISPATSSSRDACWCSSRATRSPSRPQPTRISSLSAARRWTARAISGGISSPRARTASSRPRRNGRPAISARCRATRSSSFRCRRQ